jgi:hypothetical protein
MAACRSSLEDTRKISLIPIFNNNLPRAHTESEFDMLGILGKLVKYVVHLSNRKIEKSLVFFTQAAYTAIGQFLASRNLRD